MSVQQVRSLSLLLISACGLVLVAGCQSTATTNPRSDLLRSINGANVDGYAFTFDEDATRALVGDDGVPPPPDVDACAQSPSCAVFFHDYECNEKPRLQCEANSTCKIVHGHFRWRQPDGSCIDGPTVVTPNTLRCELRQTMVDIDGLALRRP